MARFLRIRCGWGFPLAWPARLGLPCCGVASGPMTATFLLPFAMGACNAVGGDILTDAFGIVAMVAMTPLITIQALGLTSELKKHAIRRYYQNQLEQEEDVVLYFDSE